jgi:heat-inducible transcriptional repressor
VQKLLRRVSYLLAALSNNVGFGVAVDDHQAARIERIEMVQLEHAKLLVVVTLDDGMVRTCMLARETSVSRRALELAEATLNRIVSGCTPAEARRRLDVALEYSGDEASEIARSIVQEKDRIFDDGARKRVHLEGATQIMGQPEFQDPEHLRQLVRILEHPEDLGDLLLDQGADPSPVITIGVESEREELPFSLVSATCNIAGWGGHIGILGPMRMRYALALALVNNVAQTLASLEDARLQEE